jgi:hypothetical protein
MAANSQIAFNPQGKTVVVAAAAVAPAGVQVPLEAGASRPSGGQYRVINAGTSNVFLGVGATATSAQSNAVAPVAGTPSNAIVLVPGAVEVLSFGEDAYFSGLASVASTVYITQGTGV